MGSRTISELTQLFLAPALYSIIIVDSTPAYALYQAKLYRSRNFIRFKFTKYGSDWTLTIPMTHEFLEHCKKADRIIRMRGGRMSQIYHLERLHLIYSHHVWDSKLTYVMVRRIPRDRALAVESHDYTFEGHISHGTLHENRVVVEDRKGRFGYVDRLNLYVIEPKYRWAGDFEEGRAEVQSESGYGLINISGDEVIAPIYESMSYNPNSGVSAVRKDGKWAYFSYCGERLTPFVYDYPDEDASLEQIMELAQSFR